MSENVFRRDDPNLPILTLIAKSLGTYAIRWFSWADAPELIRRMRAIGNMSQD